MTKTGRMLILFFFLSQNLFAQDIVPVDSVKKTCYFADFGPSLYVGPEFMFPSPFVYNANLTFRYWLYTRTSNCKRVYDNDINFSIGYANLNQENLLKLKIGDIFKILPRTQVKLKIGFFYDVFFGKNELNQFADLHIGYTVNSNKYLFLGVLVPIKTTETFSNQTYLTLGIDFQLFSRFVYVN